MDRLFTSGVPAADTRRKSPHPSTRPPLPATQKLATLIQLLPLWIGFAHISPCEQHSRYARPPYHPFISPIHLKRHKRTQSRFDFNGSRMFQFVMFHGLKVSI